MTQASKSLLYGKKVQVRMDCTTCEGRGETRRRITQIVKSELPFHNANHTNKRAPGERTGEFLDQGCSCKRTTHIQKTACLACRGTGERVYTFTVPKPGQKMIVKDGELLKRIFGEGDEPAEAGVVFDVQLREEHKMELRTGYGVRLTWDRLTRSATVPKGSSVDLWTFDLAELEVVK